MDGGISKNIEKLNVKVIFLDENVDIFTLNMNSLGSELFQKVSIKTKLLENYFFGLSFESPELDVCWLDLRKAVRKQFNANHEYVYDFSVKFYSPDPNMLQDSLTKQFFVLQLRKDLSSGELICCDSTRILLGAFFLQLRYPSSINHDQDTLKGFLRQLFKDQTSLTVLLQRSIDFYYTLKDQTTEQTQFDLLETVRKIDFYGMKMHPAKDIEGVPLNLAVYHLGIVVFQKCTKINTFNWSRIRKLSFKRKRFLIKLHSEEYLELFILWVVQGFYKDTLEFYFDTRNSCKNFWKKCIEHHSFFRSQSSGECSQSRLDRLHGLGRNFSGSRFRYVGPTQNELELQSRRPYGISDGIQRSESAGRLMPRDVSLNQLARANKLNKYDSINCLSYTTEPSSIDIDDKIIDQHTSNIPESFNGNNIFPWKKIGIGNHEDEHLPILSTDRKVIFDLFQFNSSDNSQIREAPICSGGGLNLINETRISLAKDSNQLRSLSVTREVKPDAGNHNRLTTSLRNDDFFSYEFIPKLLAQALSSNQCSYGFPNRGIDSSAHCDVSTNNGSTSRSFVSSSIHSDTSGYSSILNSMVKDFLFNEYTHAKEIQVMREILDCGVPGAMEIVGLLDRLILASDALILRLEVRVRVDTQSADSCQASAHHFFLAVDEYLCQTSEVFRLYMTCVDNFIKCLPDQVSSPICLLSTQLQYLTKSLFHAKNPCRLLLSVIFHQRERHNCIVVIHDFLLTRDEDRHLCKVIIDKVKSIIASIEELEEEAHQHILTASIEGLRRLPSTRLGWLQRLSSKGASNRLFIVNSEELICVKKFQSNAFNIEQSWRLDDIRVGSISEMTNHTNGFNVAAYPFDLITIILCLANVSTNDNVNVVMMADSKGSQTAWIEDINKAKAKCNQNTQMPANMNHKIGHDWVQDYFLLELCWHDRISLSWNHAKFLYQLVLSCYMLRKCKDSSGWQRLWVVLSDCHLYFYRKHSDREAITSLCLVGFQVMAPSSEDSINKAWVLKLSKDSKIYFLRTENEYFYLRWLTVLQYCTSFTS